MFRKASKETVLLGVFLLLLENAISLDKASMLKLSFNSLKGQFSLLFSMETCLTLTL